MAPLSLRIVQENGVVTKKVKLDPSITVQEAHAIVRAKTNVKDNEETYGLFLRSPDNDISGVWMEEHRTLSYYMLRDGDRVDYMTKIRNLRIKMLDDSVKTLQVDQSKIVGDLMINICSRLGITNHEEYGLCLDKEVVVEDCKEGSSGTLTLKKKSALKDRDLQFEQMSKRLKTDDNVEWIDAHKTLSEACVGPQSTVLLMRRLYYSDRNVDSRDPVQLNLLYVQARDNILDARHPVTEEQASEFAGIQCQIQFGDFQEETHKSGFIENMREYMPEQYAHAWGIEKKVLKAYKKHHGLSALDAKHLYTKTARELPTYGVTFFLVKEKQKDKKKLVPRLLGINAEAILRLDEVSKEILQQWPLTHVKSYHAAKGEIFTLNFGDYSEKEYSVKTRDAYRIRDILEDYIDLIRKRMMAQFNTIKDDSAYIMQDNIQSSQANLVQHVSNMPMKIVDTSFVGPSQILTHEIGKNVCQGAQIVTVQQIVVSDKGQHQQHGVKGEVPMRGDMSIPFTRRLNRLNSNSVKIVTLLTDPTETHIEDSRKIVDAMNADLPFVREGVKETIEKQTSDDEKKKLQDQMNELDDLMKSLAASTSPDTTDTAEAGDAAMRIADLTTQMYFSLDSKLKRRSKIISRSRPSFVEDENSQRTLRKASFIAATTTAVHCVDDSKAVLDERYSGPALDAAGAAARAAACVERLGKLNAALAHYIMAHSDPKNVDYEAAINSMNTIHELIPEFVKDTQAIASTRDPVMKKQILLDAKTLCDAIKNICSSTGMNDPEKIQEASKDYAEASGRLVFTFGKGNNSEKENEMLDLADEVAAQTSLILMSAQELTQLAPDDPAAADIDAAGVRAADKAKGLILQVQLTAPTISEPHCQSAVTAAAEALSAAVQQLTGACKPLAERPEGRHKAEHMHHQVMDLARALDRLKGAYSALGNDDEGEVFADPKATKEHQRLKFINTLTGNKKRWQQFEDHINEPIVSQVAEMESEEAHRRLASRLGQLNAAIASLLAATSDREQPDYETAELAINTINELMPQVVEDTKIASSNKDSAARAAMLDHIRALCDASKRICTDDEHTNPQDRSSAIAKFTNASGKLVFGISHRGKPQKENQILELSEEACQSTSQLLSGVHQLSEAVGGSTGDELDARGALCADAAQALLTTAQLTAPSINEPRCQSALISSIDKLTSSGQNLASTWKPLEDNTMHKKQVQGLDRNLELLGKKLDALRMACADVDDVQTSKEVPREQQKLQFVKSMSGAKEQIEKAQKALNKPIPPPQNSEKADAIQQRLSGRLGELNAAIAALLAATSDRENPDYGAAETAMKNISELLPYVVQDAQSTSANKDEVTRAAMLDLLKELCEASRGLCAGADRSNPQAVSDAVSQFSDASGKLVYVINPRANADRENQIMGLAAAACGKTSQLLSGVDHLTQKVGGAKGQELDTKGAVVADAAQGLLQSAQVTAASISEPHSKAALLSSVDKLSSSGQQLAACWKPLLQDPQHEKQVETLHPNLQQLEDQLEALRKACNLPDNDVQTTKGVPREQQKLQFVKSMSGAKEQIEKAQKALNKPIPPPQNSEKADAIQQRLSGRLGELNAAIAALLSATSDRENPDYGAAENALNNISELLPYVVQDTQSTSANKDEATRAAMLDLLKELCEASRGLCAGVDESNPQAVSDAVSQFSDASGKLVYVINPRANADRENQIMGLAAAACGKTSQLLSGVDHLTQKVGGAKGQELDTKGAVVADAAQGLLQSAQVTAPSISEPHSKAALLSSVDKLSSSGQQLAECWKPLLQDSQHQKQVETLHPHLQQLEDQLEALRKACNLPDNDVQTTKGVSRVQQKLQFVKSMSGAKEQIERAQKALNKPIPPPQNSEKADAIQQRLSGRLGELNAAIAALLSATSDRDNPDYGAAENAMKNISELLPYVVQDTQSTSANKDEATRAAMLDLLKELCEASRGLCAGADGSNPQAVSDAVSQFSDASGKLVYVINPRANADRENQIMGLAAAACGKTSQLLSGVDHLTQKVGGAKGQELDTKGALVADAAQGLLQSAQVTAPTISEPHSKAALLSSVDKLSSSGQQLAECWKPVLQDPQHQQQVEALHPHLQQLEDQLEALRKACNLPDIVQTPKENKREQQKLQFEKTTSGAKEKIDRSQKALDKPIPPPLSSDKAEAVQQRLSGRLGELNAAIASLLAATSDRDNQDYKAAEEAVKTISEILPHVVHDTQSSCSNKDEATRAAMLDLLKELCEASRGLCAGADGTNAQGLNDSVAKFAAASGKLVYVVNPRVNSDREKQIDEVSVSACAQASQLLAAVQRLAAAVRGDRGQALDIQGAHVADAAQNLLSTAQLTAPSISEPHCKKALLSSIDELSSSGQLLAECWMPLLQDPQHQKQVEALHPHLQQLEAQLEALRKACNIPDGVAQPAVLTPEQQKLQFVKSMSGATEQIEKAQKALSKPIPPPLSSDKAEAVQERLSGRLGELNAAIASLLAATADRRKPDYKKADEAIRTITELMPHVVQDAQSTSSSKDEATRAAMLDLLKELCEASRGLCAGADGSNAQGLGESLSKFSNASNKLVYAANPRDNADRTKQIMELASGASKKASLLLSTVQKLPTTVEGKSGEELEAKSAAVDDAAYSLLNTAKVTAPSISEPHCKKAMKSSVQSLSSSSHELVTAWKPLLQGYSWNTLKQPLQQLDAKLEELETACEIPDGALQKQLSATEQQKLQFVKSMSGAKEQIQRAQKALAKPIPAPLSSEKAEAVQQRLAGRLGELNAAIAALLAATADREKPDYKAAEKAIKTITETMPHVVQETQVTSANKDEATRAAMMDLIKELCEASRGVCAGADGTDPQGLGDAVSKFSNASGKLTYVVSPRVSEKREKQIISVSAGACSSVSRLLAGVQQVSAAAGGAPARALDAGGAALADDAQALLATAQITASSISEPHSKAAFLSSVDKLSSSEQQLAECWKPLLQDSQHQKQVEALHPHLQQLEAQLEALRKACQMPDEVEGVVRRKAPPTPTRTVSMGPNSSGRMTHDATQEFLDRIRCEESQVDKSIPALTPSKSMSPPLAVKTDDEKRMHQLFVRSIDDAEKNIMMAEKDLKKASKSQSVSSAISAGDCLTKQAHLQRNIALAAVEVASLVGANYADTIDYTAASKSTKALPQLITTIAEDGKILSSTVSEAARQAFLADMLAMCESTRNICDAAKNDREKLNDAAVEFGDKSAKLLYIVSNDVDPVLEKEIITRAKAIGDGVAQISVSAGSVAHAPGSEPRALHALCAAGARCQDGAGKLLYTAKLVAPSIYETPCQDALYKSVDTLSNELVTFTNSWKPFASDPHQAKTVKELTKKAENLGRILEGLKNDVKGGRIGQRREIEKLVIEDTPMRQLTLKIIEDANKLSESSELSPALRHEYTHYSKKLSDALRTLDLANARCKRTPHDTNKRRELENAIQDLQVILLQSRPTRTDKDRSNIVDLRDFIDEVSSEADKLSDATSTLKVPTAADKKTLQDVAVNAQKITKAAYKLTHTDDAAGFDTNFDDKFDVDQFGQDCDEVIKDIDAQLKSMEDINARNALYSKILPLTESCNMLRFATKSCISATKSASLDSTLDDLDDIESRVINSIVKESAETAAVTLRFAPSPPVAPSPLAGSKLSVAVSSAAGSLPRAPLTAYIASCAASTHTDDPDTRNNLLKHLYKLVHLLKTQTVVTSKRIATWQDIDDPEVTTITQQILQEIQNPESKFQPDSAKVKSVINESDLTRLLIPGPGKLVGDKRQQNDKLNQLATKLNSMCGMLTLSIATPASLTRSAHAASEAAAELSAVARGCKNNKDPSQCERIEEAVQEMSFTTYGVLRAAEEATRDTSNANYKRRLMDACRGLNAAISKLVISASSATPLRAGCSALGLRLQLAQASHGAAPAPTSALPYHQCCEELHTQHEIINKLKNDQPMSREEFTSSLHEVNAAVCRTTQISEQCAYLISVSERDSEVAAKGPVDVPRIQKTMELLQDSCMAIIGACHVQQAREETDDLHKRVQDFSLALDEAQLKVQDGGVKATLTRAKGVVTSSATSLAEVLKEDNDMCKVTQSAVGLLEEVNRAHTLVEKCPLVPSAGDMSPDTKARCDELANNSKSLITQTLALVKEVSAADEESETMTWVTFTTSKTRLLDAYEALVKSIRVNGQRAGILEGSPVEDADEDAQNKTYLEIQVDLAGKWLKNPMAKAQVKTTGQQAVRHVIDIATKISEDLKGSEREEIRNIITETEELLTQCTLKYDNEKYSVLMDRVKELKKAIQRGVVTRVVEDFIEADDPMHDLDVMVDAEQDSQKRKFLLERKIAELLAQLARLTRTARVVADAGSQAHAKQLVHCTEQTELLAPMLVQAAQERISSNNEAAIEKYKALLAKYAESISKVRDLCDRAVDPMEFVQTAGETMQRMREESSVQNDAYKGHLTSKAIIKLANRSISVSMSSVSVRGDPELASSLRAAAARLQAATPAPGTRASKLPDWKESTAEVLRTTGDVESALGGENIFKKQPTAQGSNKQIYSVARDLHECVREWSSRDNEIVAVARRVAVLMARLSEYMETDKKQALISTSKSIVSESHEVAALARKLAHECTDVRIKTNLLQTCERIPTISAQLKMLTTVKGSSLGHQGTKEDTEAMDMLVGNAQSLMLSIQEVVKAAASASVKIMSQRGPKLRWVRKNYY